MFICDFLHQFISISDIVDGDYPWDYIVWGGGGWGGVKKTLSMCIYPQLRDVDVQKMGLAYAK